MKIKICGITTLDDAKLALALGADLLGLNFYQPSPRYIDPAAAAAIVSALPAETTIVGLFVNASTEQIAAVAAHCRLNLAQLHGDETPQQCQAVAALGLDVIKAFRLRRPEDIEQIAGYDDVYAVLLDAFHPELYGGTGDRFDWTWVGKAAHQRVFLAGGITPDNVVDAIKAGTYGIDLCSGVEESPGRKDPAKMKLLFERIAAYRER